MGVHDGHRERKREQFLRHGADSFADHELLELLLYSAVPRRDTNPLAHDLINYFGSLHAVLSAPAEELQKFSGISQSGAVLLKLIPSIYRRAALSAGENEQILDTVEKIGRFFVDLYVAESCEIMYQLCLDAKGRRLNLYKVTDGDPSSVNLNVRKIVENAILSQASMVALAHNHPSGVPFPSPEDREATLRIRDALEMIDVRLVEHVIVADNDYISMWESGMMGP